MNKAKGKKGPQCKARAAAMKARNKERAIYERAVSKEIRSAEKRIMRGGFPHGAWQLVLSPFQISILRALQQAANARVARAGSGQFQFCGQGYYASATLWGRVLVSRLGVHEYFLASSDCPCFGCRNPDWGL